MPTGLSHDSVRPSTQRLSHDYVGPLNDDNGSVRKIGLKKRDLQVLQQDFSETFTCLEQEVLFELSHLQDKVEKQLRQYAERLTARQQTMLRHMVVRSDSMLSAETTLLGARQELVLHDGANVIDDASTTDSHSVKEDVLDGHLKKRRTAAHQSNYQALNKPSASLPGATDEDQAEMGCEKFTIAAAENEAGMLATLSHTAGEAEKRISAVLQMIKPMKRQETSTKQGGGNARLARIEDSRWFDTVCAFILVSNAAFIGIQVDALSGSVDTPVGYTIVDCLFTFLFLAELIVRMGASPSLCVYFINSKDWSWNWFDFGVTSFAVVETSISLAAQDSKNALATLRVVRVLRVLRMLRVVRIIRVMRFFRSLRILMGAIFGTIKSGVWTGMLLVMIMYLFALVFTQGVATYLNDVDTEEPYTDLQLADQQLLRYYFGSLPKSIFTLWKSVVGGIDWQVATEVLSDVSPFYVAVFVFYIGLLYLAVLNVVAGLFLQTAVEQAQSDLHDIAHEIRQERQKYASHIELIFSHLDTSGDGIVRPDEFEEVMTDPMMTDFLDLLGLQVSDAWTLFKLLDRGGTQNVDAEDFVDGCLRLRGVARSLDIAQLLSDNESIREQLFEMQSFLRASQQKSPECILEDC